MIYYLLIDSLTDGDSWKRVYADLKSKGLSTDWSHLGGYGDVVPCIDGFISENESDLKGYGIKVQELASKVGNHQVVFNNYFKELFKEGYVNTVKFQDSAPGKFLTYNKTHDYMEFSMNEIYNSTESEMGETSKLKFSLYVEVYFHTIFRKILRTHSKSIESRIDMVIDKILNV